MKIGIVGSRSFDDYDNLSLFIQGIIKIKDITLMVSGGARGADLLGERFADLYNIEKLIFIPDWNKYGKQAGTIRNKDIVDNSDIIFIFWDGVSKGTKNTINRCVASNKKHHIYYMNESSQIGLFKGFEI